MATVLTGKNIERFRLAVIEKGLALEVKTGMRHSRNANVLAARKLLTDNGIAPRRTKAKLLEQFKKLRAEKVAELDRLDAQKNAAQTPKTEGAPTTRATTKGANGREGTQPSPLRASP